MRESVTSCPVCKGEIPVDTQQCLFCGALFAAGSGQGRLIQKGVICRRCGEKTYSTEDCSYCGEPLAVKCPSCGKLLPLQEHTCPHCGGRIKKYGKRRSRLSRPSRRLPSAAFLVVLLLALASLAIWAFVNPVGQGAAGPTAPVNPRPLDLDYDGRIERWEHLNDDGLTERVEIDGNGDGRVNRWIWFDGEGNRTRSRTDADGNGIYEQERLFWPNGQVRRLIRYSPADQEVEIRWIRFRPDGGMIEEAGDLDGDGAIDRHYRYTADGRRYLEGRDTDRDGHLDEFLTYNVNGVVVRTARDADGNGINEYVRALSVSGNLLWEAFDEDQDGLIEKKVYYRANGNLRWVEYDTDGDGNHELSESYTRRGVLARTGTDTDGDTSPDYWR